MGPSEAENYRWNVFDMTKVWPQSEYPLRPVAKLTLNENVCLCLLFETWFTISSFELCLRFTQLPDLLLSKQAKLESLSLLA
jgi:Catalase